MGLFGLFRERLREIDEIQKDADHMRSKYGSEAAEMCLFAIRGTSDGALRRKLKQAHIALVAQDRGHKRPTLR